MNDTRRIAAVAVVMLVVLRLAIGWQLLYEGLWKIKTLNTPTPWTAAGYLKNAQGPFRGFFRSLAGDPDDMDWLDVAKTEKNWSQWQKRFERHYRLSDGQKKKLNTMINGAATYEVEVEAVPDDYNNQPFQFEVADNQTKFSGTDANGNTLQYEPGKVAVEWNGKRLPGSNFVAEDGTTVSISREMKKGDKVTILAGNRLMDVKLDQVVHFNPEKKRLVVDGRRHLSTSERETLIKAFEEDGLAQLVPAAQAAYKKSKDGISYVEQLRATVRGNPDWVEDKARQRVGEIRKYQSMLQAHEDALAMARTDFQFDHLSHSWEEIQSKRAELVGPVKALDKELKDKAIELLSVEQIARGPVGKPWTPLRISDLMTILGLTILGGMLILGVGTRFAAIMAAFMLFMFYAAMPPWPGVPEAPGPEHSFIVNKNFIEVVALVAIACLPSGRWFGVDGMVRHWRGRSKAAKSPN